MNSSDDRTRVIGAKSLPASTGTPNRDTGGSNVLPVGTRLDEFEVIGLVGEGGFGIVYLALDHSLERRVALKEYMPSALASRGHGMQVSIKSARHAETFETGLRSFVNEAKLLAHFDHDALVKVHRFWEANGTAYMVMPYYEGVTLKQALRDLHERPGEQWLISILTPLLDALELMHSRQCFHRDIAPDNVLILTDGRPLLLDFGAARRVIGDMTQALTVILKPGFAPIEQYADAPEMKQGPWTDVYALAALIYYAISGKAPAPAVARMMNDTITPARQLGRGAYSAAFLQAIDDALVVQPERRTASMTRLRLALGIAPANTTQVDRGHTGLDPYLEGLGDGQRAHSGATSRTTSRDVSESLPARTSLQAASATYQEMSASRPVSEAFAGRAVSQTPATIAHSDGRAWLLLPAAVLTLVLAGGVGWWLYQSGAKPAKPTAAAPTQLELADSTKPASDPANGPRTGSPPGTQSTQPILADNPNRPETAESEPSAPAASGGGPLATGAGGAKPAFSPRLMSDLLFQARSPDWPLTASASPLVAQMDKDAVRFAVRSERHGFLYIFMFDAAQQHWWLVFPNGRDRNNRVSAGASLSLPRSNWSLTPEGPPGPMRFLALTTETPRDFSAAGLKLGPDFGEFDLTAAASAYDAAVNAVDVFAGSAKCAQDQPACTRQFAAAQFEIEVVVGRKVIKKQDAAATK